MLVLYSEFQYVLEKLLNFASNLTFCFQLKSHEIKLSHLAIFRENSACLVI